MAGEIGLDVVTKTDLVGKPVGLLLRDFLPGSPVNRRIDPKAGAPVKGDILVQISLGGSVSAKSYDLFSPTDLQNAVALYPPGTKVRLRLPAREGQEVVVRRARGRPGQAGGPREVRRKPALLGLLLAALAVPPRAHAADSGAAALVEKEFSAAIRALSPATVFCLAREDRGPSPGSSGVLVTKTGYVLSDGDAGAYFKPVKGPDGKPVPEKVYADEVEIRIPDLKKGTYGVYLAKIVRRVAAIDSTLLKITSPPAGGFPFVSPSTADRLDVGAYTFAMGMAFGRNDQGTGTLTAGIVASLVPAPEADGIGRWLELYTSAAVNPGVNGGPLVDADGALVGIISTWGSPDPDNPFQFLGKAYPIDRIRKAYLDLPEAATVFPDPKTLPVRSKQTELLERAFGLAAAQGRGERGQPGDRAQRAVPDAGAAGPGPEAGSQALRGAGQRRAGLEGRLDRLEPLQLRQHRAAGLAGLPERHRRHVRQDHGRHGALPRRRVAPREDRRARPAHRASCA